MNCIAPITKAKQNVQQGWTTIIKKVKINRLNLGYSISVDKYAPNIPIFLAEILQRRELKYEQLKEQIKVFSSPDTKKCQLICKLCIFRATLSHGRSLHVDLEIIQ